MTNFPNRNWVPIISETTPVAAAAWDAIFAITHAIENPADAPPRGDKPRQARHYEQALLFGYIGVALHKERRLELAAEVLNSAIEQAGASTGYLPLHGGLCGLAWTTHHFATLVGTADSTEGQSPDQENDGDLLEDVDLILLAYLKSRPPTLAFDLISGLVGIGTYFLEKLPSPRSEKGISLVLDQLERIAESDGPRLTWHSGPELLPEWQREVCPGGYYNLGVAHGIPGILFFLCEVVCAGIESERALAMLDKGMDWFLARQLPQGSRSRFRYWIPTPGKPPDGIRLSWCYGDLGILAVISHIAQRLQRREWLHFSSELLDQCLANPDPMSGVSDAPLCHGAVGNAHIYNRLYQMNGDVRCRDAALYFIDQALAMRRPGQGIGGFFSVMRPDPKAPSILDPSPDFLDGAGGVALGLLAALTPVEPEWDRLLLLSGRKYDAIKRRDRSVLAEG